MRNVSRAALRVAGLMVMALLVAHCGDSTVRVTTGVSPTPGTFGGTTGTGEAITIVVGSIDRITVGCHGETLAESFVPPAPVNSDGTFDVEVIDKGKTVHVSGRFGTNDSVAGTLDDEAGECDTSFDATRSTGNATPTRTPTPVSSGTAIPTATVPPTGETATPTPTSSSSAGTSPTPTATAACPSKIEFVGTAGSAKVLDAGWTGQSHDSQVVSEGKITVSVTGCQHTSKPCGVCTLSGPIANVNAANYTAKTGTDINNQRCTGDTSATCASNGDCSSAGGTCQFYFGTYLPLSAGGVSTCVGNVLVGAITGTANTETGASASVATLTSRVFTGPTADNPCPKCVGDATANDGKRDGTCNSGKNTGAKCDINGASANVFFGSTSLDCPPLDGGLLTELLIDLSNTTGTKTLTLSAANPNCRTTGFTTLKCFCDTCDDAAAKPCSSNTDCGGSHICGGKRCQGDGKNGTPCTSVSQCPAECVGGSNAGAVCTVASQCPGAGGSCPTACGVPGLQTAPNNCNDATCSDQGICEGGPFEQFCEPDASFKSCTSNAECASFPGNTCSGKNRSCFTDNGAVGGSVSATGVQDTPVNGESDPTLAALFCIGPTGGGAVDSVAGLPGLGRLELPGHAREIP